MPVMRGYLRMDAGALCLPLPIVPFDSLRAFVITVSALYSALCHHYRLYRVLTVTLDTFNTC